MARVYASKAYRASIRVVFLLVPGCWAATPTSSEEGLTLDAGNGEERKFESATWRDTLGGLLAGPQDALRVLFPAPGSADSLCVGVWTANGRLSPDDFGQKQGGDHRDGDNCGESGPESEQTSQGEVPPTYELRRNGRI